MNNALKGLPCIAEKTKNSEEINLLMIGNSYCYFYLDELAELAELTGIKLRAAYLYYSGCRLEQHYNMWKAGDQLCKYCETLGKEQKVTENVGFEFALSQRNWDVISLQLGGRTMRKPAEEAVEETRFYRNELYGYLRERFPEAELLFHHTWTFEIGHTKKDGFIMKDLAQQIAHTANVRAMSTQICLENKVRRINTGDAWEIYRNECMRLGIPHNLCARLGKPKGENTHLGDGTHDGDIGGGQLLNACVWYEILTSLDCRENPYIPIYEWEGEQFPMEEAMANRLKEAAHKAVHEILPTYPTSL